MKNIYVLIGPPLSGKETQGELLELSLGGIPRFSMGHLIREARITDPIFEDAFQKYSMQGKHLPDAIKFPLLAAKMNDVKEAGFILDNFPGTAEDIEYLEKYLETQDAKIKIVIVLSVSEEEMRKRFQIAKEKRGRADDTIENVADRRAIQDKDREAVVSYYKKNGLLVEINGEQTVENVHNAIMQAIRLKTKNE